MTIQRDKATFHSGQYEFEKMRKLIESEEKQNSKKPIKTPCDFKGERISIDNQEYVLCGMANKPEDCGYGNAVYMERGDFQGMICNVNGLLKRTKQDSPQIDWKRYESPSIGKIRTLKEFISNLTLH